MSDKILATVGTKTITEADVDAFIAQLSAARHISRRRAEL